MIALTDEAQAVRRQYGYDDWGNSGGTSGTLALPDADRARWKGALWMGPELDLYYMRNRWYEPATGRFLSEDPIGLQGGINPVVFARGNTVNGRDPTGLDSRVIERPKCKINCGAYTPDGWLDPTPTLDGEEPETDGGGGGSGPAAVGPCKDDTPIMLFTLGVAGGLGGGIHGASMFGFSGISIGITSRRQIVLTVTRAVAHGTGLNASVGPEVSVAPISGDGTLPLISHSTYNVAGLDAGPLSISATSEPSASSGIGDLFRGRYSLGGALDVYQGRGESYSFATPPISKPLCFERVK